MSPTIPQQDKNVNFAPHVVLLGAGASIAAFRDWGSLGPPLPSMQDLIDCLELREEIEGHGHKATDLNFEDFYDDLASSDANGDLREFIERRTYEYFSAMKLPPTPTIYDYLILSLREKDIIATFNWDPFLLQAYMRNEVVSMTRRPRIAFLHGNVLVGSCAKDRVAGVVGHACIKCGNPFMPSQLLYPVKQKDYTTDEFIKGEWDALRWHLKHGYYLTVFGYSAPKTDVEARKLMLEVWQENKSLELCEVDVVDVKSDEEVEEAWREFFYSHHYGITNSIWDSYLFKHPRRSCDAFASATLMLDPWRNNPFPRFNTLSELHSWVEPLIAEEAAYEESGETFSGKPIWPNIEP